MALLVKYGVIGAQPWRCMAEQPGATHFLDKGQEVFGSVVVCGRTKRHNAAAICWASLIEAARLCARSWRVTCLCVPCVMVWHCHYGWVLTAGGMDTDRELVLVVLTLAGHNNLLLVKQVSSWQNHYCLHMVMRGREGLGNRFRGGWSWAMALPKMGEWGKGGERLWGGGVGALGLFSCITEHWRVVLNCHNTN